ncbi:MAG: cytochrome b/b6 domain-containing protein [Pseudomonadota bacterium]
MSDLTTAVDTGPARFGNTESRFGGVAKTFHWLTALLILTMIPLGIVAQYWPYDTSEALAVKADLFSLHKTLGLVTFVVALLRIAWAIVQPRPALLPAGSRAQTFAAETVHFALYTALVLVPLSGWIHHAASTGFAPIWWPFGQTLPFVPQSVAVADAFAGLHFVFNIVLVAALALHIGGALKHHVIDGDATLRRMMPGTCELPPALERATGHAAPAATAAAVWSLAVVIGLTVGLSGERSSAVQAELEAVSSEWVVQEGTLAITVQQLNQPVTGQFADWTAAIAFDEEARDGVHGQVDVTVSVPSLTLGSVTTQALAADFLNAGTFSTATFSGPILAADDGYVVDGVLTLVGQEVPLSLPFALEVDGDTATATGTVAIDRRDFGMGATYQDEATVGFTVDVSIGVTATRGGQ